MDTIKILQWNVLYQEKAENILQLIQKISPDIFCGQELTADGAANPNVDVPAKIAETCKYEYLYQPATVNFEGYDGSFKYGDGIFSRFPIKAKRSFKIFSQEDASKDHYYIETDVLVDNKLITIGTVHLLFSTAFEITPQRMEEAENLFGIVQQKHERFILTGDFNATPDSQIIKKLSDIFIHADPNTDRPTWTTKPFSYQGFEANERKWRLDYIFCTEDINVVSNKIIDTPYSDHLPILTEIQI